MSKKLVWGAIAGAVVLIGNFYVLMRYGYALRSTNLFIARGLVFYPLAWLNLLAGTFLLIAVALQGARRKSG